MHRNAALGVVKAATRLKILAQRQRREREEAEATVGLLAEHAENGYLDDSESEGDHAGSWAGGPVQSPGAIWSPGPLSPQSRALTPGIRTPRTPRSDMSLVSAAASLASCKKHKAWYSKDIMAVNEMVLSSKINILMLCVPLGIAAQLAHWGAIAVFILNFLALIPLALLLGDVTEDLAVRFGDTVGGLLNATFGNVVEMILSIAALQQGLYTVVSSSLLGSILSNLLLVLGCCFLFGGIRFKTQSFNAVANQATSSLLFLSCIGIIIPTAAGTLNDDVTDLEMLSISRGTAIIMLLVYLSYLSFQLHTHNDLFRGDDGDEEPVMSLIGALFTLAGITVLVAVCSEYLCSSIEEFSLKTGLSQAFLGMIVLPIAGNACEHITAVVVAMKNKMDLSLGVAVGSSIQIAVFAIPFVVIVGWITGHNFTLDFDPFATLALTVSVIHANFVTSDALSHWLMGVALITNYAIIALVFLYKG